MKELFEAIYSKYTSAPANAFYTATGGRYNLGKAKSSWVNNFAVIQGLDGDHDRFFRGKITNKPFQINVFSSSAEGCEDLIAACLAMLDGATLEVENHYPSTIFSTNDPGPIWNEQDNLWQATIEFSARIQHT